MEIGPLSDFLLGLLVITLVLIGACVSASTMVTL